MNVPVSGSQRRITIADVAALARVDRSVVSRVINDDPILSIRDDTRRRVLDAIATLGYRPNAAARSLRTTRTRTFGLLIPDFANPVYAEIIKGAEQSAAAVGCMLVTGSSGVTAMTSSAYLELLGHGRVDGLLLATGLSGRDESKELDNLDLPWLFVNRIGPNGHRYVVLDDERAAALAVGHLVELGHVRIGHLAGPRGADTARRRRQGYAKGLRRAGIDPNPAWTIAADYTPEDGFEAMQRFLQSPEHPTAVFVASVAAAVGALHAVHRQGLRVPDDISVVAVHDLALAAHLVPPLTTVRMPLERLGARAIELLLGEDRAKQIREVVSDPIELVVRESTAPPAT